MKNKTDFEYIFEEMEYKTKRLKKVIAHGRTGKYEWFVVSFGTHPCAYVVLPKKHKYIILPKKHKYHGKDYFDIPITCHGGLTFAGDNHFFYKKRGGWIIGWDYAHAGDYMGYYKTYKDPIFRNQKKWTVKEIIEEIKNVIKQLDEKK